MSRSFPKPLVPSLVLVAALTACGSPPDPSGGPDGGASSGSDGGSEVTSPDGGGEVSEPVRTATITLGTTTRTVVPNVRRGLISSPDPIWFSAEATSGGNTSVTLGCLPAARGDKGGRTISIPTDAVLQAGGIICENGGGGLVDARIATRNALLAACAQKSSCTVNLYDAWMGGIWGCSRARPDQISINYSCNAQASFSPAMVFEYTSEDLSVSFSGLDGEGSANCSERNVNLNVPGHAVETCTLDLTTRTGSNLSGVLTATLRDSALNAVPLTVDFRHERNTLRPSLQFLTQAQSCASSSITHTTTTVDGVTTDTLKTSGPFTCQPGGSTMESPPTVEVAIRRPEAGVTTGFDCSNRVQVSVNGRVSANGGGCRGNAMDEEPHALRAWLGDLSTCNEAVECVAEGTLLMNYDFSNPAP